MSNLIPIALSDGLKVSIFSSNIPTYLTLRCIHIHFETKIHICFMIMEQIQVPNTIIFMISVLMDISPISGNLLQYSTSLRPAIFHQNDPRPRPVVYQSWPQFKSVWLLIWYFKAKHVQIISKQRMKSNAMFLVLNQSHPFQFYWILCWSFCFWWNKNFHPENQEIIWDGTSKFTTSPVKGHRLITRLIVFIQKRFSSIS